MRFNSQEHLDTWKRTGQFPFIHDDLFSLIANYSREAQFMDLCCSTGLLGRRVVESDHSATCVSVDGDALAMNAAVQAGVFDYNHRMTPVVRRLEDTASLVSLFREHTVRAIIARRCLPELFGDDLALGKEFAQLAYVRGVREIFLEGRVRVSEPVNALSCVEKEMELFTGLYRPARRHEECVMLARLEPIK